MDTFNPECFIQISNVNTFNFLLNPLSLWISVLCFTNESTVHSLNGTQNLNFSGFSDWLFRFLQMPLNWLSYIKFCWYKLKIKLILKLTKNEDQALISISTILKFSAQFINYYLNLLLTGEGRRRREDWRVLNM